MRGQVDDQLPLFHLFSVEDRIRPDHPLRDIKRRVDRILDRMSSDFTNAYSMTGRPSVPPERLLKALLLMALYSVRSERQLCERIDTDLLFRWFLDLQPSDEAFDATTFTHNRQRWDDHRLTRTFFAAVVGEAITSGLCSEHFSVDGTLIESWPRSRVFSRRRRATTSRRMRTGSSRATRRSIFTARGGRTRRIKAGPIRRPSYIARVSGRKRNSATWDMP